MEFAVTGNTLAKAATQEPAVLDLNELRFAPIEVAQSVAPEKQLSLNTEEELEFRLPDPVLANTDLSLTPEGKSTLTSIAQEHYLSGLEIGPRSKDIVNSAQDALFALAGFDPLSVAFRLADLAEKSIPEPSKAQAEPQYNMAA